MNKNLRKQNVAGLLLIAAFLLFSFGQQAHAKAGKADDVSRKISDIYTSLINVENGMDILSHSNSVFVSDTINSVFASGNMTVNSVKPPMFTLRGTVFPFVYTGHNDPENSIPEFDSLYVVTASLYSVPPIDSEDPLLELLTGTPVHTTKAVYYDGSIFIPGTPKNPGFIGSFNNPGLTISWEKMGHTPINVDTTTLTAVDNRPSAPIGLYTFEGVLPGNYILVLSTPGAVTRYGKITVNSNQNLGHRGLVFGDVNGDLRVNEIDISAVRGRFCSWSTSQNVYKMRYDVNKDGIINETDISLILYYLSFHHMLYKESFDWLIEY